MTTNIQPDNIDITGVNWKEYHRIMISLDYMIQKLEKQIGDIHLDNHRVELLAEYKKLFQALSSTNVPWRGQAISLDDNVIEAVKKK
jgi:hypothetical protein